MDVGRAHDHVEVLETGALSELRERLNAQVADIIREHDLPPAAQEHIVRKIDKASRYVSESDIEIE